MPGSYTGALPGQNLSQDDLQASDQLELRSLVTVAGRVRYLHGLIALHGFREESGSGLSI